MTGETISHYKILEKLGEGGMGVVYKAEDLKLDRPVALKFLPEHLLASEQDKSRFVQEAKSASALNHPNVATVYEIDEAAGRMFIAMEFVDGVTLREKMGGISIKQAIDIGIQLADGLAAAHEKGIVHRDIKPENIMVRKDGICQIMDFGLAKLRGTKSKISRLTKEGSTIGTAGYMSPEQVQGQDVDHRSDIFSLGVVLYELFTGQLPFKGVHETALLYEIVNVDAVPMSAVKPGIDPGIDAIVLECLSKDRSDRFQSVAEVSKDLRRFKRESSRRNVSRITAAMPAYQPQEILAPQEIPGAPPSKKPALLPWSIAAFLALASGVLAFLVFRGPAEEPRTIRFAIPPPEKAMFESQIPAISPDGLRLAFIARDSMGNAQIWIRALSTMSATPLTGTEDAAFPFWSPDSRFIGFFQSGKLKKIDVSGGPAQTIADAPVGRGGTWSNAGVIVFSPLANSGLVQVAQAGGTPTELTTLDSSRNEDSHRWPCFLPDGRRFVYLRRSSVSEKTAVFLGSFDSKDQTLLLTSISSAVYAAPGYLLFVRERSLMAQPFDGDKGQLKGDAFPIVEEAGYDPTFSYGFVSASQNGVLAVGMGGGGTGNRQLAWYDRSGKPLGKVGSPGLLFDFALPRDEKRVVFRRIDRQTRNEALWMLDLVRGTESRFTFRPARDDDPVWSPDGTKVLFDSNPEGANNLHLKVASGAGSEELLLKSSRGEYPLDWSTDGGYILYETDDPKTKGDLWILPMKGDKTPFPFAKTEANEYTGRFSPDGRWIVYSSDESGKFEVYVQAFPQTQGKWQVSTSGGAAPLWSRDGKEIFYLGSDKKLMAVAVNAAGASFEQGIPQPLFDTDVDAYQAPNRYAATSDGKRFLINVSTEGTSAKPIAIVVNWLSDIKR